MNPQATIRRAEHALTDATTISVTIAAALTNLDLALAGWPTSTPGASPLQAGPAAPCRDEQCTNIRPCPVHDDEPVELTSTERLANDTDRARRQLDYLHDHIRKAEHHLAQAAAISHRWAWHGIDQTTVKARLTAIDASIWCENCSKFGRHEPREQGRKECRDCANFRRDYKRTMTKPFWDAKDARNGRLDVGTIERILKRVKAEEKLKQQQQKAEQKAAKHNAA